MKIYSVGGAVRDQLLGLPVQDRDYVVVGAMPDDMLARGFKPVGKDFPVFLHPHTHEEYALARTERKTAPGYKGFVFHADSEVTLEQDLLRRDLTINAMAQDEAGTIVDPFDGRADLQKKLLRHVSSAFAEDPVRILRVARFSARFSDFTVAEETNALMRQMTQAGEVDALVPERVWQELARGLMEAKPSRMFEVLRDCGALARILPELDALWGVPQPAKYHPEIDTGIHVMMVIDVAAREGFDLPIRFAALTHDLGKGQTPKEEWPSHHGHEARSAAMVERICQRLKIPGDCRDLGLMTAREHGHVTHALSMDATAAVELLARCDAFRKPDRFLDMLRAAMCDHRGRTGWEQKPFPQARFLERLLTVARQVDAGAVARRHAGQPQAIAAAVHAARVAAVAAILQTALPT